MGIEFFPTPLVEIVRKGDNSDIACFVAVDLVYPDKNEQYLKHFPNCPEKKPYSEVIKEFMNQKKLAWDCTYKTKDLVHFMFLKFYVRQRWREKIPL